MRVKADGEFVRRQNRHLLVETLRRHGPLARIELGRKIGLSPATITSITGDLLHEQLLLVCPDEEGAARHGPGRPLQRLTLNPQAASVLGIEISVDGVKFVLAAYDGSIIERQTQRSPILDSSAGAYVRRIAADAGHFMQRQRTARGVLQRVGVSVQGIADASKGTIAWSPAFKDGNIEIVAPLEAELGVDVFISNDTNLAAQALLRRHPLAYSGSAAVVFVGYGIGMGLIIDGAVYPGPSGAAAEFGHMNHIPDGLLCRCGRHGCIEAYAADYGIFRAANGIAAEEGPMLAAVDPAAMTAIEQRARAGDPAALSAFQQAGSALGYGLARTIALLELERVALVGSGLTAFSLLEPSLRQGLEQGLPGGLHKHIPVEVEPSNNNLMTDGLMDQLLGDVDRRLSAHSYRPESLLLDSAR
jgi:predicted NBD/HSP70 family sugar kinase